MDEEPEFNAFVNDHTAPEGAPLPAEVRDPTEDTAPLQGSHDFSDEDSVAVKGASPTEPREANAGIETAGDSADVVEVITVVDVVDVEMLATPEDDESIEASPSRGAARTEPGPDDI